MVLLGVLLFGASSCSKKNTPAPMPFKPDKSLLLGIKWTTTSAIVTKPDGSTETWGPTHPNITGNAFLLGDVTFNADGTAIISDYSPSPIKWTLTGATLQVTFLNADGSPEGDQVIGTITKLDAHNLTIEQQNVSLAITYPKVVEELTR